eukprot:TRINITY_DN6572_c0_g2_i1.p1 TRINITY_DN6572_c0_g2~~TRINITY_DN6572_c0_g2_i1.p1  ORF type:complete len:192 (-),score=32.45 TRINITY_DN6572_c0_g2_i1:64-639(-)
MGCSASDARDDVSEVSAGECGPLPSTIDFLLKVPVLARLPKDKYPLLAEACVTQRFRKDEVIIREGDIGNEFFIIRAGLAIVSLTSGEGGARCATLHDGDFFGERALLYNEKRSATVTAASELTTVKVSQEKFRELGLHEELVFSYRKAVRGGAQCAKASPPSEKTPEDKIVTKITSETQSWLVSVKCVGC